MARSSSPFPKRTAPEADIPAPDLPAGALVPVNSRHDGWTPVKQRAFIETLADTGSVTAAAGAVGMSPASAYRLRRRTDARAFDAAWEAALGRFMDQLIPAAMDRALNGTARDKYYHGEVVGTETVFHEKLMIWLLEKGAAMLRHAEARQAITDDWDGTMEAIEAGETTAPEPAQDYRIWLQSRLVRGEPIEAPEDDGDEDEYGLGGNGSGGGHDDDDSNDWLEDYCLTNCPPPPGFKLLAIGNPGDADYMRYLTAEEEAAWRWQGRQSQRVTHYQEAARRRLFTLDDYALDKARAHARRSARRAETAAKKAATAAADADTASGETTLSTPPLNPPPAPPRIDAHTP
jgi:hypothetical protein